MALGKLHKVLGIFFTYYLPKSQNVKKQSQTFTSTHYSRSFTINLKNTINRPDQLRNVINLKRSLIYSHCEILQLCEKGAMGKDGETYTEPGATFRAH
jgi:hypothetical protein